jgi:hypothetical protein
LFISPIAHTAVLVECAEQLLLLEGMLAHFSLVDLDAQAGLGAGADGPSLIVNDEAFGDDVVPPGDVGVDVLANDLAGLGKAKLQ